MDFYVIDRAHVLKERFLFFVKVHSLSNQYFKM